jgi:DNA-binding response OmpR family regulator
MSRILLVEDDPFLARAYEVKFSSEGLNFSLAKTGQEGLDKMKAEKPDLLLLDIMLPGRSGFEVLEEMKQSPELKDVPVVVLSNLGQEDDIKRALSLGAKEYLIKTDVKLEDVAKTVRKYLNLGNKE